MKYFILSCLFLCSNLLMANRLSGSCYDSLRYVLGEESKFQYEGRKFVFLDESGKIIMSQNSANHISYYRGENNERIVEPEQYQVRQRTREQIRKELLKIANLGNGGANEGDIKKPTVSGVKFFEKQVKENFLKIKSTKDFEEKRVINNEITRGLFEIKHKILSMNDRLKKCRYFDEFTLMKKKLSKYYEKLRVQGEVINSKINKDLNKKRKKNKYCNLGELTTLSLVSSLNKECHRITKSDVAKIESFHISSYNQTCQFEETVKAKDFKDFKNISTLSLQRCALKELGALTKELKKHKNLKVLNLSDNQLSTIDIKDIEKLNLEALIVNKNPIDGNTISKETIKYLAGLNRYDGPFPESLTQLEVELLGMKKFENEGFKSQVLTNYCMSYSRGSDYIGQCLLDEIKKSKKMSFDDFRRYCHFSYNKYADKTTNQCYELAMKSFYKHPEMKLIHKNFFLRCSGKSSRCYDKQTKAFLNSLSLK